MKLKILTTLVLAVFLTGFFCTDAFSQAQRKVLFEEWTSSTCGPCASNNPILDAYIAVHRDTLTVVKYHVGWPSPGNDPMYLHNPTQSYDRRYYYNVNAVPWLNVDGIINDVWPFSELNFQNAMNQRMGTPTPMSLSVQDYRIAGDSIKAVVTVTNLTNLSSGNYYLRVMSVEKKITYPSPPGTNGETIFWDVFRHAFPSSQGTAISTNAGTYIFEFKYKPCSIEVDSMMHTIAFVQNDNNKETMNSNNSETIITSVEPYSKEVPSSFELSQNYPNPFNPFTYIRFAMPKDGSVSLKVYDVLGNEVKTLVEGNHRAGTYNIYFDGSNLASGVYFYRIVAVGFTAVRKMILLK
jgi:hypothetical protein